MKYIRTKDGRIIDISNLEFIPMQPQKFKNGIISAYKGEPVIAQADTIEELCDEFVIEHLDGDKDLFINYNLNCQHRGDCYYNFNFNHKYDFDGIMYGAIWTDKGLIYVAKMNDKGELELI